MQVWSNSICTWDLLDILERGEYGQVIAVTQVVIAFDYILEIMGSQFDFHHQDPLNVVREC